eukprot:TRINITY_DN95_c0_g1_i8.p1 TRINITY_DN95_c0_g1~~TRINITY_DN95_c0_g1_i8.p1  ORF type:complete len:436 (+),score=135.76 TRINITY_DN95_c0_g1_i8:97-1404(+)
MSATIEIGTKQVDLPMGIVGHSSRTEWKTKLVDELKPFISAEEFKEVVAGVNKFRLQLTFSALRNELEGGELESKYKDQVKEWKNALKTVKGHFKSTHAHNYKLPMWGLDWEFQAPFAKMDADAYVSAKKTHKRKAKEYLEEVNEKFQAKKSPLKWELRWEVDSEDPPRLQVKYPGTTTTVTQSTTTVQHQPTVVTQTVVGSPAPQRVIVQGGAPQGQIVLPNGQAQIVVGPNGQQMIVQGGQQPQKVVVNQFGQPVGQPGVVMQTNQPQGGVIMTNAQGQQVMVQQGGQPQGQVVMGPNGQMIMTNPQQGGQPQVILSGSQPGAQGGVIMTNAQGQQVMVQQGGQPQGQVVMGPNGQMIMTNPQQGGQPQGQVVMGPNGQMIMTNPQQGGQPQGQMVMGPNGQMMMVQPQGPQALNQAVVDNHKDRWLWDQTGK